jgi:type VI protein secretion system component VasF
MSQSEDSTDPLAAFFEAQEAPAADPVFRAEVMEGVARRRFRLGLVWRFAAAVLLVLVFWASAPVLQQAMAPIADRLAEYGVMLAIAATGALAGWTWLSLSDRGLAPGTR